MHRCISIALLCWAVMMGHAEWRIPVQSWELLTEFSRSAPMVSVRSSEEFPQYIYPISSGRILSNTDRWHAVLNNAIDDSLSEYQRVWILHNNGFASVYLGSFAPISDQSVVLEGEAFALNAGEEFLFGIYDVKHLTWINPYYVFTMELASERRMQHDISIRNTHESLYNRDTLLPGTMLRIHHQTSPQKVAPVARQVLLNDALVLNNYFTYVDTQISPSIANKASIFRAPKEPGTRVTAHIRSFYSEIIAHSQVFFFRIAR